MFRKQQGIKARGFKKGVELLPDTGFWVVLVFCFFHPEIEIFRQQKTVIDQNRDGFLFGKKAHGLHVIKDSSSALRVANLNCSRNGFSFFNHLARFKWAEPAA